MSILATILNTLVVILAVLLIALILVQPTKSGGDPGVGYYVGTLPLGRGNEMEGIPVQKRNKKFQVFVKKLNFHHHL